MTMHLLHPYALLGLTPLALVAYLGRRHLLYSTASVRILAFLHLLVPALLVISIAQPRIPVDASGRVFVAVVDISNSIAGSALRPACDAIMERLRSGPEHGTRHLIVFDGHARRIPWPQAGTIYDAVAAARDVSTSGNASDLAGAISLAGSLVRSGQSGTVVLASDGLETLDGAEAVGARVAGRGISLLAIPMGVDSLPDAIVRDVRFEQALRAGETAMLTIHTETNMAGPATITVADSEGLGLARRPISLRPGRLWHRIAVPVGEPGTRRYKASIQTEGDRVPANNAASISARILPRRRVAVVEPSADGGALGFVRDLLQDSATVSPLSPRELLKDELLLDVDLLILSDYALSQLPEVVQLRIRSRVAEGMGLLLSTGRHGGTDWGRSPLAQALPVSIHEATERRDPSTTVVIIIDTSGSMGNGRIDLARASAWLALRQLKAGDLAGIVEFHGARRWAAPIQSAGNIWGLRRALNRLSAGGGTVILPAIEEAYYSLLNVQTRTKHVIVLTDGGVERGAFKPLLRKMAESGVTVSTVLVGPQKHSAFLMELAQWGGGRFYAAPDRFHLPEIRVKIPDEQQADPFISGPMRVEAGESDVLGAVTAEDLPGIMGLLKVEARPTADIALTAAGRPLLVHWQYGLGNVAFQATHLAGPWTADWPGNADACRMLRTTFRWLIRPADPTAPRLEILEQDGRKWIEATLDANPSCLDLLRLDITDGGTRPLRSVSLLPTSPGRWRYNLQGLEAGQYHATVSLESSDRTAQTAWSVSQRPERCGVAADMDLFARLEALPRGNAPTQMSLRHTIELWPWLAGAALTLLLMVVVARRWPRPASLAVVALGVMLTMAFPGYAASPALSQNAAAEMLAMAMRLERAGHLDAAAATLADLVAMPSKAGDSQPAARIRLAQLHYQSNHSAEARAVLLAIPTIGDREEVMAAAHVASLCGDHVTAIDLVDRVRESLKTDEQLFRAHWLLQAERFDQARRAFQSALETESPTRQRRYVLERVLFASRKAGQLPHLVDAWSGCESLAADELLLLVHGMVELGRSEEALDLLFDGNRPSPGLLASNALRREAKVLAMQCDRLPLIVSLFEHLVKRRPADPDLRAELAHLLLLDERPSHEVERCLLTGVKAMDSVPTLMKLATMASEMRIYAAAERALDKADRIAPSERFSIGLHRARLARARGAAAESVGLLESLAPQATGTPARQRQLAAAFGQHGDHARADALLREAHRVSGSFEILAMRAFRAERAGQVPDAVELWWTLWKDAPSPSIRMQGRVRLVELAGDMLYAEDIIDRITRAINAGGDRHRLVGLLVEIHLANKQVHDALESLDEHLDEETQHVDRLQRLALVLLRVRQYERATEVFRTLAEADPNGAADYHRQLAMVAVEQRDLDQADRAVEALRSAHHDSLPILEFCGDVLHRLEQHSRAVAIYEKILASGKARPDVWLLWSRSMAAAGRRDQAIARLEQLLEEARHHDLFAIAVDGLLNLKATKQTLRFAMRRVRERLGHAPSETWLYRLGADVAERLSDGELARRFSEQAIVIAGPQRTALLREMMTRERLAGQRDKMMEVGRSLVAIGEQAPPDVFLSLGKAMLDAGVVDQAERAFRMGSQHGDRARALLQATEYYEDASRPRKALLLLRELRVGHPDRLDLMVRAGELCEQVSDHEQASEWYLRACRHLLRHLPVRTTGTMASTEDETSRPRRAVNQSDFEEYFEHCATGLLASRRTEAARDDLVSILRQILLDALRRAEAEKSLAAKMAENPQIENAADLLLRAAYAFHSETVPAAIKKVLHETYPQDAAVSEWLADHQARWLAPPRREAEDLAKQFLRNPADLPLESESLEPTILHLVIENRRDAIVSLLGHLSSVAERPASQAWPDVLLVAAEWLDDRAFAAKWAKHNISVHLQAKGSSQFRDLSDTLRTVWNALDADTRERLIDRVSRFAREQGATSLQMLCLRLNSLDVLNTSGHRSSAAQLAANPALPLRDLGWLLDHAQPERRGHMLEAAIQARPAGERREMMIRLLHELSRSLGDEFEKQYAAMFNASPPMKLSAQRAYSRVRLLHLQTKAWLRPLAGFMAEEVLSTHPDRPEVMTTAAITRIRNNKLDEAMLLCYDLVNQFAQGLSLDYWQQRMLEELADALPDAQRQELIEELGIYMMGDETPVAVHLTAACLHKGHDTAARIQALQAAYRLTPDDATIGREVTYAMRNAGHHAELADFLLEHLTHSTIQHSPQWRALTDVLIEHGRHEQAAHAAKRNTAPLALVRLAQVAHAAGRDREARILFHRFTIRNRAQGRLYVPTWPTPASAGGIMGFEAQTAMDRKDRPRMYEAMLNVRGIPEDLIAMLAAARPDRRDIETLCEAIAKNHATSSPASPSVLDDVLRRSSHDTLTAHDIQLILAFVREAPSSVPYGSSHLVDRVIRSGASMDEKNLHALTTWLHKAAQGDRASRLQRWHVLSEAIRGRRATATEGLLNRWQAWLDSLSPESRAAAASRLLALTRPVPADAGNDALLAARLDLAVSLRMEEATPMLADARRRVGLDTAIRWPRLAATAARVYGARGEFDASIVMLSKLLRRHSSDTYGSTRMDIRTALPDAPDTHEWGRFVDMILQTMGRLHQQRDFSQGLYVRQLCLLGVWCARNGLDDRADRIMCAVKALEPIEQHRLWWVDLQEACGEVEQAREIELALVTERRLPVARMDRLLQYVQSTRGVVATRALARRISTYCRHPSVLKHLEQSPKSLTTPCDTEPPELQQKGSNNVR